MGYPLWLIHGTRDDTAIVGRLDGFFGAWLSSAFVYASLAAGVFWLAMLLAKALNSRRFEVRICTSLENAGVNSGPHFLFIGPTRGLIDRIEEFPSHA